MPVFRRFWIPVLGEACGRCWRTSDIRLCGWRNRSIGNSRHSVFQGVHGGWPGLFILNHMHNLSDEVLCARWLESPYYQFFCDELSFWHQLPFGRWSVSHWRQRLGEVQVVVLIQACRRPEHWRPVISNGWAVGYHGAAHACPRERGGGQSVPHAKALHGDPFDGHTLGPRGCRATAADRRGDPAYPVNKSLPLRSPGATAAITTHRNSASGSAAACVG